MFHASLITASIRSYYSDAIELAMVLISILTLIYLVRQSSITLLLAPLSCVRALISDMIDNGHKNGTIYCFSI